MHVTNKMIMLLSSTSLKTLISFIGTEKHVTPGLKVHAKGPSAFGKTNSDAPSRASMLTCTVSSFLEKQIM